MAKISSNVRESLNQLEAAAKLNTPDVAGVSGKLSLLSQGQSSAASVGETGGGPGSHRTATQTSTGPSFGKNANKPGIADSIAGYGGFVASGLTTSAEQPTPSASGAAESKNTLASDYTSAAKGHLAKGSGGPGEPAEAGEFDEGTTEGAKAAVDLEALGRRSEGGATAGTTDPEDYFTRIHISENIFKRIETRLRTKSAGWAQSDLMTPAQHLKCDSEWQKCDIVTGKVQ